MLLIPGFMAGDASLARDAPLAAAPRAPRGDERHARQRRLRRADRRAPGGAARAASPRECGGPVVLIGQSRGGALARALAVRHPESVCGAGDARLARARWPGRLAVGAAHGALGGAARRPRGCRGCSRPAAATATAAPRSAPICARRSRRGIDAVGGLLAQRRHRRLARLRRPPRRVGRGRLEPLRHVGSSRVYRVLERAARRAARRSHGVREPRRDRPARLARLPRDDELRQRQRQPVGARRAGRRADRARRGRGRDHVLRHRRHLLAGRQRGRHRAAAARSARRARRSWSRPRCSCR